MLKFIGKLISIAFVISAIGALNGSILSNARVLMFETYCRIHKVIDVETMRRTLDFQ